MRESKAVFRLSTYQMRVIAIAGALVVAAVGIERWMYPVASLALHSEPIEECKPSDLNVTVDEVKQYGSWKCNPESHWKPMLDWLLTYQVDAEVAAAVRRGDHALLWNQWPRQQVTWCGDQKLISAKTSPSEAIHGYPAYPAQKNLHNSFASSGQVFMKWLESNIERTESMRYTDNIVLPETLATHWSWCRVATQKLANDIVRRYNQRLQFLSQGQAQ